MVGEIKVFVSPAVVDYLDTLVYQLYKKEYFGFIASAEEYVISIYNVINSNIHLNNKPTPEKLLYLGSNYIFFNPNKRTTWYIFFEKKDTTYLVTGILNNYSEEIRYL
jgi:hypothetical protein